jgi:hypothetical protein
MAGAQAAQERSIGPVEDRFGTPPRRKAAGRQTRHRASLPKEYRPKIPEIEIGERAPGTVRHRFF